MPIGIIVNCLGVIVGGIVGSLIGPRLTGSFKDNLNLVLSACAMTMGISSIFLMKNMPVVILSIILGTVIGLTIHLGKLTQKMGMGMEKIISKIIPCKHNKDEEYSNVLVTAIVLFCASGTGIYGSITAGMTGDHSILLAKTVLDFATALIFACVLEMVTCVIAVPQFILFMILFLLAGAIYPLCSETMICDFKACGGVLLIATGFRMMKVKNFPIADMIPSMALVMPFSYLWVTYVLPFVS
ncbi:MULTISPECIES: DUF554 domain-containing protein [Ruminococcus]|uniref:DUF554 domain-containing protein n=1 Tax=Ruminococcus bovis TaxID=2564099 RepID=A0A4P8XU18_9FIRM|nr:MULTISPECIES: DUF554 domain-containing protein [Ruminococcus]MEE3439734.1 DUF554 domain-containing protein [Ruminococcus sp.]QCT06506.1 DUF554 domain-containing protein [Ruminococcus bovis]